MPSEVGFTSPKPPSRRLSTPLWPFRSKGIVRLRPAGLLGVLLALGLACASQAETSATEAKASAAAGARIVVETAELGQSGDRARLELGLTAPVEVRAFPLSRPDRVILDLPEVDFAIREPEAPQPRGKRRGRKGSTHEALVTTYRFGRLGAGRSRIVLTLSEPARILRAFCEPAAEGEGARLVVELARTDAASFRTAVQAARATMVGAWTGPRPPKAETSPAPDPGKPIVVIDPGHGGIDSGAIVNGSIEKDLVLDFARAVAGKLEAEGKLAVVLTRGDDSFVPLAERVAIARTNDAGLFVSIHADTLADATDVGGATVYTVSERASDATAARLAEKENAADAVAGLDRGEEANEVSSILQDLTRRETRALSHVFARTLLNYWRLAGRLNKNPQRSAGFMVLKAPDVPSVLLELGYLTNSKDGKALSSSEWREAAATRVAAAIAAYFSARENAVASTVPIHGRVAGEPANGSAP